MTTPVLVTLTAPSCGGKSYLFNYIRDEAKLPCLISTTTRRPRAGEVDGVDYHFITEEESIRLELAGELAELAIYRGVRYGVTKQEFFSKLNSDEKVAFLIVEPSGIGHYAKPAIDAGAHHLKVYIDTEWEVRLARLKNRLMSDILAAVPLDAHFNKHRDEAAMCQDTLSAVMPHFDRLVAMTSIENTWKDMVEWDLIVSGDDGAHANTKKILEAVFKLA